MSENPAGASGLVPTIADVPLDRRPRRQRESADPVARYLGDLQAAVMELFWRRESATVREVADKLNKKRPLAYTTVLTLVSRLFARGLLAREPEGRGFRYRATKSRDEFLAELSDQLIDRLFADFGAIGVARVGERLNELDEREKQRLARRRKKA
jgi:predicted transcriptional regulator